MAYSEGDYTVNVRGNAGDSEQWSNTWSFRGSGSLLSDAGDIANRLNVLYTNWGTFASWLSPSWLHAGAVLKDLFSGELVELSWSPGIGSASTDMLPTQLAMRVSLNGPGGVQGGPFLAGFCEAANSGSRIQDACVNDFIGALETFTNGLTTDGIALSIHRPTTHTLVDVSSGRIGHRWDVIRKRANDTAEQYSTFEIA